MATTAAEKKQPRVPVPPFTKRQQEEHPEQEEEREGEPVEAVRGAIREARRALDQAEDALADLS